MAELTECLVSVQEWMNDVKLKLNPVLLSRQKSSLTVLHDVGKVRHACYYHLSLRDL